MFLVPSGGLLSPLSRRQRCDLLRREVGPIRLAEWLFHGAEAVSPMLCHCFGIKLAEVAGLYGMYGLLLLLLLFHSDSCLNN